MFGTLVEAMGRFEDARRALDHAIVLDRETVERIASGVKPEEVLEQYVAALKAVDAEGGDTSFAPVLPVVRVAERVVEHTTCTNRTILRLEVYDGSEGCRGQFNIYRLHGQPLDPSSERDQKLIALVTDATVQRPASW